MASFLTPFASGSEKRARIVHSSHNRSWILSTLSAAEVPPGPEILQCFLDGREVLGHETNICLFPLSLDKTVFLVSARSLAVFDVQRLLRVRYDFSQSPFDTQCAGAYFSESMNRSCSNSRYFASFFIFQTLIVKTSSNSRWRTAL